MTQIFLIRHGEAEGNLYRWVQGQVDLPLTPRGREQISHLTARFADTELRAAYASDYSRAYDTALAAVGRHPIRVERDERLREMGFGVWEGHDWGEIHHNWREEMELFRSNIAAWHVPGSETLTQVQDRMETCLTQIARRHDGGSVAVAGHGMAIRALLTRIKGLPNGEFASVTLPGNASVTLLRWEGGVFHIEYENDVSHLSASPFVPNRTASPGRAGGNRDLRFLPFDMRGGRELYLTCYRDAWRGAHGTLAGFDAGACWRGAVLRAGEDPHAVEAAWLGDDFAGILALDLRRGVREGVGWIAFCYILPELRRQHCGVQLIGRAVRVYRGLGRRALRLTVAPGNPAVEFYKKTDFVPVGKERGALEDLLVMEKTL